MTFLYDIGRVLLDFDFESSLSKLLPEGTEDVAGKLALLLEKKDELEAGKIGADRYIEWALRTLESGATADEFKDHWRNIFTPNEPMWEKVRNLKAAGHRLILFSNINSIHTPWIFENYPEFSLFEGAVLSHETGFIKPQPEIYHHAIRKYGLQPARTLYIDDMEANIRTGQDLGFRCWRYDLSDHGAFEEWLGGEMKALANA